MYTDFNPDYVKQLPYLQVPVQVLSLESASYCELVIWVRWYNGQCGYNKTKMPQLCWKKKSDLTLVLFLVSRMACSPVSPHMVLLLKKDSEEKF